MGFKIRDWEKHFEQDRSKQWKSIKWVPIPNKQGAGYRRIMAEKNGLELFACWIALVEVGSTCSPRGDLSKYDLSDLARLTLIDSKKLGISIKYLSEVLDWLEVINNLDKNVNECQKNVIDTASGSSILFNSIQGSSIQDKDNSILMVTENFKKEVEKFAVYQTGAKWPAADIEKFVSYWTEPNKSKTKVRFQLEKTWDTSRRLNTWASRDKNFQGGKKQTGFDSEKYKRENGLL